MKKTLNFAKRNVLEMLRDPMIYIFCIATPVAMLLLFAIINHYTNGATPMFEPIALVPGVMMFSFSFVMLLESLLVSKDRQSSFLIRLYTSPMKINDYIVGYTLPSAIIGIFQEIFCLIVGYILSLAMGLEYFSFGKAILLCLEMLPMLITFIFFGIFFGTVLTENSAPGICSAIVTGAGILGGAWMPLDTMGGFETFCRFLPFYSYVYMGRAITGAVHTPVFDGTKVIITPYAFDNVAKLGIIPMAVFFVLSFVLCAVSFKKNMKCDK